MLSEITRHPRLYWSRITWSSDYQYLPARMRKRAAAPRMLTLGTPRYDWPRTWHLSTRFLRRYVILNNAFVLLLWKWHHCRNAVILMTFNPIYVSLIIQKWFRNIDLLWNMCTLLLHYERNCHLMPARPHTLDSGDPPRLWRSVVEWYSYCVWTMHGTCSFTAQLRRRMLWMLWITEWLFATCRRSQRHTTQLFIRQAVSSR